LTDDGGTTSYTYDELDRVATIVAPNAAGTGTDTIGYTYNHRRPHSSLGWRTPAAFAATVTEGAQHNRPQLS